MSSLLKFLKVRSRLSVQCKGETVNSGIETDLHINQNLTMIAFHQSRHKHRRQQGSRTKLTFEEIRALGESHKHANRSRY